MSDSQFVIHILAVFGTPVPHPLAIKPGENCMLGHRIIEDPNEYPVPEGQPAPPWPLLANGQQFVVGLDVDASFTQGGGLFLEVVKVRARNGATEVWFRWASSYSAAHVEQFLTIFNYQVISDAASIVGPLPDFFPGLRV